jgi:MYXO-CTERM domain-containing protein
MEVDDRIGPGGTGSDPAAYERWFNEQVLPAYVRLLSGLPLTGAVFGASGYHAVVRQLHTTGDHVVVGSDLFVAPASDDTAPETSLVEAPRGVVSLAAARLLVAAEDSQVPAELLRFQVTVDGTTRPLDVVREIRIGEPGKTATYEVEVAAVDLAGNVDDSPVALALTVDGQAPEVALTGPRVVNRGTGPLSLAWRASDDTSAAEELATRVEVYEIDDPTDLRSRRLIERHELEAGSTSAALALGTAALYRTEVHVRDRAGNESFTYALVRGSSGCGCDTAGDRLPAGPLGLLLGSLALLWRARRRRA